MRRTDRQQSRDFALSVIERCTHGTVAFCDGDRPYCIPLSLVRVGDDLYFHCAREGRKSQLMAENPKVCVSFVAEDSPILQPPCNFTTCYQSAEVTGTVFAVTDEGEKIFALRALCEKLTPGHMAHFSRAIESSLAITAVWRIHMEEVTGKAKLS